MRQFLLSVALSVLAGCASRNQHSISLYEKGDYAGAARAAEEGLASHPKDEGLWQMRVRAAVAQGDRAAIAAAYARYRQVRHEDDHALVRELAIATLEQALASPSVKMKVAAIQAVEAAEIQSLAETVAERMGDNDDRVAAAAAIAVLRGYPQAPEVASDMLRSELAEARRIAIEGIGKKVGKLAAEDLQNAATDPDPRVRRAAIRWLGQIKHEDAAGLLVRRMKDPDEGVRAAAATSLAQLGPGKPLAPNSTAVLPGQTSRDLLALANQALADRALAVRLAAIDLLVAGKLTDRLAALAEQDADPMVAAEAAIAAKRSDLAARALDKAAAEERWATRAGAVNLAVRALGKDQGLAFARRLAGDKELAVRLASARVLAHHGDKQAAAAVFAEALANPELMLQAATDLAELGDARGTDALDAAIRDAAGGADRRASAASAHRGARRITPGLVAALADPSGVVRVEAAAVLVAIAK